jgi:hypothetical protein
LLTFNRYTTSLPSALYCQSGSLVKAKDAFVIDFNTFPPQQGMNASITKTAAFRSQLNHSTLQLLIFQPRLGLIVQYRT